MTSKDIINIFKTYEHDAYFGAGLKSVLEEDYENVARDIILKQLSTNINDYKTRIFEIKRLIDEQLIVFTDNTDDENIEYLCKLFDRI